MIGCVYKIEWPGKAVVNTVSVRATGASVTTCFGTLPAKFRHVDI